MSKENEDGVERFFRKAANQSDTSFMAEDWLKMEKMLDERFAGEMALRRRRIKRTVASTLVIGALLFSIYYISFRSGETLVGGERASEQKQAAVVPKQGVHPNPAADLLFQNKPEKGGITESYEVEVNEESYEVEVIEKNQTPDKSVSVSEEIVMDQRIVASSDDRDQQQDKIITDHHPRLTDTPNLIIDEKAANFSGVKQNAEPIQLADNGVVDEPLAQNESINGKEIATADTSASLGIQEEKESIVASRWSVNILVAPDFSTTALSRYSAPGTLIGLLVGYQFGRKVVVHAGANYSFKRYKGYGDEYNPPYGYWERRTNGIVPDAVQGRCEILEIPVVLQYNIRQSSRSRVFVSAGLSSYIMLDEQYDYAFAAPNPGAADGWSSRGSTSYPWAIGGISVGYDKQLTPAISMGIEPFLKVPFGKIGWSNITLYTTGFNVNMRYRFLKSTTSD